MASRFLSSPECRRVVPFFGGVIHRASKLVSLARLSRGREERVWLARLLANRDAIRIAERVLCKRLGLFSIELSRLNEIHESDWLMVM